MTLQINVDGTQFTQVSQGGSRGGYGWSSPRWSCDTCQRTGYGTETHPSGAGPANGSWGRAKGWATSCLHGHAPCPWCDRILTLRMDGTPRVHARCPNRPDEVELLRLVTAEARNTARLGVRGPLTRDATQLLTRLTATSQETR